MDVKTGAWLRSVREALGLDLEGAGWLIGIDGESLSRVEAGSDPCTVLMFVRLCKAYKADASELLSQLAAAAG